MIKKSLIVTTLAAAGIGLAALPAEARHHDDRAAGAIIGGTIGALIGSSVHGGDGALVGGVLGAVIGAGTVGSHGYYGGGYYRPHYYGGVRYAPRYGYGYNNGYYRAGARDADRDGVPNPLRPRAVQPALALSSCSRSGRPGRGRRETPSSFSRRQETMAPQAGGAPARQRHQRRPFRAGD